MMAQGGGRTTPTITVTLDDYAINWVAVDDYWLGSNSVTGTPSGGSSYTYLWQTVSGSGFPTSPTAATTSFVSFDGIATVFRLQVTDVSGAVGYSPNLSADP